MSFNEITKKKFFPLFAVIVIGVVILLFSSIKIAEINIPNQNGATPLIYACNYSRSEAVINILLDNGAAKSINSREYGAWTALMYAIRSFGKDNPIVKRLIDEGAELTEADEQEINASMMGG